MQAIARVNRVFRDKPGGLVVDYLGLADELKQALATYTESGGTGRDRHRPGRGRRRDAGEVRDLLRHLPRLRLVEVDRAGLPQERLAPAAGGAGARPRPRTDGKERFIEAVTELSQAFALAVPHEEAHAHPRRRGLLPGRAVRSSSSARPVDARAEEELDHAIRQIVSKAVASDEVIDIFAAAGLEKPDISILSDEFLAEVRGMPQRNLAVETAPEAAARARSRRARRKNVVQARSFAEMLEKSIRRYQNRAIEAAQVIEELIAAGQGDA